MKEPIRIERDDQRDTVTINGICYSQEVFRQLGGMLPERKPFQIIRREDGCLTVMCLDEYK